MFAVATHTGTKSDTSEGICSIACFTHQLSEIKTSIICLFFHLWLCCFHTVPGVKDDVERECLGRKLLSHFNDSQVKFPSARLEHATCWLSITSGVLEPPETSNAFRPYILYARDWCLCCSKGRTRGLKSCLPFRSRLLWVGCEFGRQSGGASSCSPQDRRLQFDPPSGPTPRHVATCTVCTSTSEA